MPHIYNLKQKFKPTKHKLRRIETYQNFTIFIYYNVPNKIIVFILEIIQRNKKIRETRKSILCHFTYY